MTPRKETKRQMRARIKRIQKVTGGRYNARINRTPRPMTDADRFKAMKALGVKWQRGHAIPTYPASMTMTQKVRADALYDQMSEEFIDSMGVK